jgi:hypothetical protein
MMQRLVDSRFARLQTRLWRGSKVQVQFGLGGSSDALRSKGQASGAKAMGLCLVGVGNFRVLQRLSVGKSAVGHAPRTALQLFVSVPSLLQAHPSMGAYCHAPSALFRVQVQFGLGDSSDAAIKGQALRSEGNGSVPCRCRQFPRVAAIACGQISCWACTADGIATVRFCAFAPPGSPLDRCILSRAFSAVQSSGSIWVR